jgi:hypothetical protein
MTTVFGFAFKTGHTTGIVTGFTTKGYRVSAKQQLPGFALKWGFGSARRVIGRITTERVGAQVRRWSGYRAAGRKHFF